MIPRPDLLGEDSPDGIEVFQITTEKGVPSCHVYMEAQIFTPDSKRFVLHRSAHPHGSNQYNPEHRYLLCDLENNGALTPLTHETGVTAPVVSPDGRYFYYLVNETEANAGTLTLKRVNMDGTERTTIHVLDRPFPGTSFRPCWIYCLATIRSDGKRLMTSAAIGNYHGHDYQSGLFVYDLEAGTVELIAHDLYWGNAHPQYTRSEDPDFAPYIMVQHQHRPPRGRRRSPRRGISASSPWQRRRWRWRRRARRMFKGLLDPRRNYPGSRGCDIHLIRDDGSRLLNFPWGRDGNEFCQGHQCWRGRTKWGITSTNTLEPRERQLVEGLAVPFAGHVGLASPGGVRNNITQSIEHPLCCHFATDIESTRIISDWGTPAGDKVVTARLGEAGKEASRDWTFLIDQRTAGEKRAHSHPFLSPDGSMGFYNSTESGDLQAYMIRGLDRF